MISMICIIVVSCSCIIPNVSNNVQTQKIPKVMVHDASVTTVIYQLSPLVKVGKDLQECVVYSAYRPFSL